MLEMNGAMCFLLFFVFLWANAQIHEVAFDRVYLDQDDPTLSKIPAFHFIDKDQERLINYGNMLYVGTAMLGSPPQKFRVIFDTASSTAWFADKTANVPSTVRKFDSSASSTYKKDGRDLNITYLDGSSILGFYGNDKFCFTRKLCTKGQPFGQGINFHKMYRGDVLWDGIVGMALPQLQRYNITPPFQRLMRNLPKPIFSFWASTTTGKIQHDGGVVVFGGEDKKRCETVKKWIPIKKHEGLYRYYKNNVSSVKIGNTVVDKNKMVVSDTGSAMIFGPYKMVKKLARLAGAHYNVLVGYIIDCDAKPDDIIFTIDGVDYAVSYKKYVYLRKSISTCIFSLYGVKEIDFWILGDTFIRQYCTVYDPLNLRFGFGKNKT